jgi:replicative DNA helicase
MTIITDITNKRNRILTGFSNSIEFELPKFDKLFPGYVRGKSYIITANTKVGKSQFTVDSVIIKTLLKLASGKLKEKVSITIYLLEMSEQELLYALICRLYAETTGVIIEPKILQSIGGILDEENFNKITDFIKKISPVIYKYVTFVENCYTALEVANHMQLTSKSKSTEDYNFYIVDHIGLFISDRVNANLFTSIGFFSKFVIKFKKLTNSVVVMVQQQSADGENIEAVKFRQGRPTLDNLADNKSTGRDVDCVIGLYSPARHNIPTFLGNNINVLRDNYRYIEILADRNFGQIGLGTSCLFDGRIFKFKEINNG